MNSSQQQRQIFIGIGLAVLATLIWSGNFIVARGMYKQIPPVSLAFYRWLCASIIILPFAIKKFRTEWPAIKKSWHYFFWISLTGVSLFNTFVYIGGHYTSAINLALIGTTSSPIISVVLARIFLKEKIGWFKIIGMILCVCGILFLLSKGNIKNLLTFHFTKGDIWVLLAAFFFSVYNTMVKKKPASITPVNFLFVVFSFGTILLLPFYFWEVSHTVPTVWNIKVILVILYLGIGASVICYFIWNIAIHKLGAGRTALFGNLIPVFSSIEAVLILHEQFTWVHIVSMTIVFSGILLANRQALR
ncbi:MAG: DMT family transporter [Bacteroidia bacterium]|nr:DMT family transporter [Bacteroidia bacterium]